MTSPAETTAPRELRIIYSDEGVQLGEGINASSSTGFGLIGLANATTYYVGHVYAINASNVAVAVSTSQAAFRPGVFLGVNFETQPSVVGDGSTTFTTLFSGKVWFKNATSTSTITAIGTKCYFETGEYVGNTASTFPVAGNVLALVGGAGGDVLVDMTDRS